jgi:acyl-CoA reductase-like NAD-dependent aldehyde dehydrogenase
VDVLREDSVYIAGKWVPASGAEVDVENPATECITGVVRNAGPEQVAEAVAAAAPTRLPLRPGTPLAEWGAFVRSGSTEAVLDGAARNRAGQVDVNGAAFNPAAPFGGHKQSGVGREIGEHRDRGRIGDQGGAVVKHGTEVRACWASADVREARRARAERRRPVFSGR